MMDNKRIAIAIDGPAGAGKSTIAKALAKELHILCLDTGAMYRAAALKALRLGIDPNDAVAIPPMIKTTSVTVENINGVQHTYLDGEDVSGKIRTQEISKGASDIGVHPEVRIKLVEAQREFARQNDVVMDGRDIGSYVLKDAPHKFYITASVDTRAERRLKELRESGNDMNRSMDDMRQEIIARDYTDSNRAFAPLMQADDAILVDTTNLSIAEAIETVLNHIRAKG